MMIINSTVYLYLPRASQKCVYKWEEENTAYLLCQSKLRVEE
jgi:hypothetical protein